MNKQHFDKIERRLRMTTIMDVLIFKIKEVNACQSGQDRAISGVILPV